MCKHQSEAVAERLPGAVWTLISLSSRLAETRDDQTLQTSETIITPKSYCNYDSNSYESLAKYTVAYKDELLVRGQGKKGPAASKG